MNMIDFGLNPQQALDAPRWQWIGGKTVEVEQDTPNHIIRQLQRMGHNVVVQPDPYLWAADRLLSVMRMACCAVQPKSVQTDRLPASDLTAA